MPSKDKIVSTGIAYCEAGSRLLLNQCQDAGFFYAKNFVQNIVLEKSSISAISDIDAPF
jgi:hypothetical protein